MYFQKGLEWTYSWIGFSHRFGIGARLSGGVFAEGEQGLADLSYFKGLSILGAPCFVILPL